MPPECQIFNSAAISIPTGAGYTTLTFDSEVFDTGAMHSTSSNTDQITMPEAGIYLLQAKVRWAANATAYREFVFVRNETDALGAKTVWPGLATAWPMTVACLQEFAVNDYVECWVRIGAAGAATNVEAEAGLTPYVHAIKLPDGLARCSLSTTAAQTIPNNDRTAISFDLENSDDQGMHDAGSPTRVNFSADGWYAVFAQMRWAANTTGFREVRTARNGQVIDLGCGSDSMAPTTSLVTQMQVMSFLPMLAGDYLEMYVGQNSGGNLVVQSPGDGLTPLLHIVQMPDL